MNGITRRYGKLLLLPCALLCCLAVAATAQAEGGEGDVPYCIGGHTEAYAPGAWGNVLESIASTPPYGYWTFPWEIGKSFAEQEADGMVFSNGNFMTVFVPVTAGACEDPGSDPTASDPPAAPAHNHSPLCYSTYSDDVAYFDTGDIAGLLSRGYSVPAVTKSGDGYRFVCNWSSNVDASGAQLPTASTSGLVSIGKKLGSDRTTVVADSFAGGNDGWWEILEPKAA